MRRGQVFCLQTALIMALLQGMVRVSPASPACHRLHVATGLGSGQRAARLSGGPRAGLGSCVSSRRAPGVCRLS